MPALPTETGETLVQALFSNTWIPEPQDLEGEASKQQKQILHLSLWAPWSKREETFSCWTWQVKASEDSLALQTQSASTKAGLKLPKDDWSEIAADSNPESWAQLLAAMWVGSIPRCLRCHSKLQGVWHIHQSIGKAHHSKSYCSTDGQEWHWRAQWRHQTLYFPLTPFCILLAPTSICVTRY